MKGGHLHLPQKIQQLYELTIHIHIKYFGRRTCGYAIGRQWTKPLSGMGGGHIFKL